VILYDKKTDCFTFPVGKLLLFKRFVFNQHGRLSEHNRRHERLSTLSTYAPRSKCHKSTCPADDASCRPMLA
jgi:hypothetical protein